MIKKKIVCLYDFRFDYEEQINFE